MNLIHPDAGGIDVGSRDHFVAVPSDRADNPVRSFGCMTPSLVRMANWLLECKVTTVAMESTGVYWIPVAQMLEKHGIEVVLVNAAHVKGVPGRKSDVSDSQWLQQLHSFGLLRGAFRPSMEISILRGYWRHRETLVEEATRQVLRMQKSLEQMNIQLHKAIADITGVSGMNIIRAILSGERNPVKLAGLANYRIKVSPEDLAAALTGDWRSEHIFILGQGLEMYEIYQKKIADCDHRIEAYMEDLKKKVDETPSSLKKPKRTSKNAPDINLREMHWHLSGVDLTQIDGIDVLTAQTIYSEIGFDVDRFPTEKHFSSWLALCPNNRITGGKVKSSRTRTVASRVAKALRQAAFRLHQSKSWMGAYYRKMRARLGPPGAITATAHKLAQQVYRMLKYGSDYVDKGAELFEQKQKEHERRYLMKLARKQGLELLEPSTGEVFP